MPRDGSNVYSKPAGTTAVANTPIASASYNAALDDLVNDANAARPITAGGTGSTTAATARVALGVVPQTSETDATAGRLLINGAWGLGSNTGEDMPVADCHQITRSGFYQGVPNVTQNMPEADGSYSIVYCPVSDGTAVLLALPAGSTNPICYKYKSAGTPITFSSWRILVGVVSAGSNANGTYVEHSDGRIVCTAAIDFTAAISTAHMGGFRTATQTWTFPKAFAAAPVVSVEPGDASAFGGLLMGGTDATQAFFALTAISSQTSASRSARLIAIGS